MQMVNGDRVKVAYPKHWRGHWCTVGTAGRSGVIQSIPGWWERERGQTVETATHADIVLDGEYHAQSFSLRHLKKVG